MGYQPLPNCDACPSSDFLGWGARCFGSGGRRPRRQAGTLSLTQRRAIALQPAACICNKLQICIYIYTCIYYIIILDIYIHACMHACMHTYLRTCIHTYVRTYIHTCVHACIQTYIHTYYPSRECWKLCMFDGYMGLQLGHYNPWLVDRQI